MPRRRGRLRRPARRLRGAGPRALRRLPGRQPRPRGARRARHRLLLGDRGARRSSGRGRTPAPATLEFLARARAGGRARAGSASSTPRPATRSGSTCSRSSRPKPAWTRSAQRIGADRPLPRRALLHPAADGGAPRRRPAAPRPATAPCSTSTSGDWLLNPGSVGQPRDGDPRAAWLELDTEEWTARYHRVPYDVDRGRRDDPRGRPAEPARRAPLRSGADDARNAGKIRLPRPLSRLDSWAA